MRQGWDEDFVSGRERAVGIDQFVVEEDCGMMRANPGGCENAVLSLAWRGFGRILREGRSPSTSLRAGSRPTGKNVGLRDDVKMFGRGNLTGRRSNPHSSQKRA
jgi:hypothetical protein